MVHKAIVAAGVWVCLWVSGPLRFVPRRSWIPPTVGGIQIFTASDSPFANLPRERLPHHPQDERARLWVRPVLVAQMESSNGHPATISAAPDSSGYAMTRTPGKSAWGEARPHSLTRLSRMPARPTPAAFGHATGLGRFSPPARLPQTSHPHAPRPDLRGFRRACARPLVAAKS